MTSKRQKRWKGLQIFGVHLGVFDYTVKIVLGPQDDAMAYIRWFTKSPLFRSDPTRRGLCAFHNQYCPVIWIPRKPRTAREHATLAHECFHAVGHVTRWAAIQHSEATEEVFCHALGCLVHGVLRHTKE